MKGTIAAAAAAVIALCSSAGVHEAGAEDAKKAAPPATSQEKLAEFSPEVRQQVSARVAQGERLDDVIETLVLNEAASRYPEAKFYRVVPPASTVLVAMPDNTMRAVAYDPATLKLKP